ncbi:MAG TPA: recombinase family protein [Nocardioides sp.]|nr:recombinase family protein [Nocardioides sp.]
MTTPDEERARLEAARAEGRERLKAGIYTRISLASMGDTTKTDDQERICRDLAGRLGWDVAADCGENGVYTDHSKSAWQRNRKRPGWDQMLADVKAGKVSGIVVYHGDRLVRRPEDLADLMRLAEAKGVKLASPTGTRDLDTERLELWIRAAFAEEESQRTSERRKAQYERWRREGRVRPGGRGGRPYGFATDGMTRVAAECEVIREMARRILEGESVGSVSRDMSARGARTPAGKELAHGTVRKMLARPRYAGLMPDGESKAAWEPVLERADWERLCLVLEARAKRHGYATNARRWLLSGIARCGRPMADGSECGAPMRLNPSRGRDGRHVNGYQCTRRGCSTYRSAEILDAYVSGRVLGALNSEGTPEGTAPAPPDMTGEWRKLATERAATEALVADHAASPGRVALLMRRLDGIDARMAELRQLEAGDARSRLLARYRGLTREQWEALPLEARRSLVAAAVTVTVLPASRRGPGFRPQDVRVAER